MTVQVSKRRFTVDDYHQMAQAGIFRPDDRVELMEGEIIEMSPIGERHAACVDRLTRLFVQLLGVRAIVRVQNPIRLGRRSEPQPDVALLRPRADFYAGGHPGPGDVLLVVEVADTSQEYDRDVKMAAYADAGIPEAWLADLASGHVEVHGQPVAGRYTDVRKLGRGESLTPIAFPDCGFGVDEILG